MKTFLICFTILVALCFAAAFWFVQGADNVDARATASLLYLPCLALAAADAILVVVCLICRALASRHG